MSILTELREQSKHSSLILNYLFKKINKAKELHWSHWEFSHWFEQKQTEICLKVLEYLPLLSSHSDILFFLVEKS